MLPRLQRYAACRYNELELRWTTKETWVFQRTFNVSAAQLNYSAVDLLLTGVDTVAEISVDDVRLASTANAHRRARHLGRCMAPAALSAALRVPRRLALACRWAGGRMVAACRQRTRRWRLLRLVARTGRWHCQAAWRYQQGCADDASARRVRAGSTGCRSRTP